MPSTTCTSTKQSHDSCTVHRSITRSNERLLPPLFLNSLVPGGSLIKPHGHHHSSVHLPGRHPHLDALPRNGHHGRQLDGGLTRLLPVQMRMARRRSSPVCPCVAARTLAVRQRSRWSPRLRSDACTQGTPPDQVGQCNPCSTHCVRTQTLSRVGHPRRSRTRVTAQSVWLPALLSSRQLLSLPRLPWRLKPLQHRLARQRSARPAARALKATAASHQRMVASQAPER